VRTDEDEQNGPATSGDAASAEHYAIRVQGRLPARWSAWFDGLSVTTPPDGTTVISGPVADQSALHGLLQKLRDLGIPLLAVARIPPAPPTSTDDERH
jgi:hypothetical protein